MTFRFFGLRNKPSDLITQISYEVQLQCDGHDHTAKLSATKFFKFNITI